MAAPSRRLRSTLLTLAQALDDPARIELLLKLARRPQHVEALADGESLSRPTISHHLAVLKRAGFVSCVRQGRRSIYSAEIPALKATISAALDGVRKLA